MYNTYVMTVTIPQKLTKKGDLVVIPRKEYEEISHWYKIFKQFKEFTPTPTQKRALTQAEKKFKQKKTISYRELAKKLGLAN